MNKFEETFEKWNAINDELANDSVQYIKGVIEIHGSIEFDPENDEYVSVPYDGGRHPEYASNMFSDVYSVFMKNGKVMLEIDDAEEYDINRCDAIDKYNVASMVKTHIDNLNK